MEGVPARQSGRSVRAAAVAANAASLSFPENDDDNEVVPSLASSDPDWSPDLELAASVAASDRFKRAKQRIKRHFRRRRKKKNGPSVSGRQFSVSRRNIEANLSTRSFSASVRSREREIRAQNAALAQALNARLVENHELEHYIGTLRQENLALVVERSELRKRVEQLEQGEWDLEAIEASYQRRLVEYLEPVKNYMSRVLDHTHGLSENLTQAMHLVSAPARRSRSAALAATFPRSPIVQPNRPSFEPRSAKRQSLATVAHVSPRVGGHVIHKPQIEIRRLDMNDILRLQRLQRSRGRPEEEGEAQAEQPDHDGDEEQIEVGVAHEEATEEEEEPLAPQHQQQQPADSEENSATPERRRRRTTVAGANPFRMSIIGEEVDESEEEAEEEAPPAVTRSPMRRRQKRGSSFRRNTILNVHSPYVLLTDVSDLLGQYNLANTADDDADSEEEEEHQEYRETPEQFSMRMWDEDPMEGPSWLFGDNNKARRSRIAKDIVARKRKRAASSSTRPIPQEEVDAENLVSVAGEQEEETAAGAPSAPESLMLQPNVETVQVKKEKKQKKRTVHWATPQDLPTTNTPTTLAPSAPATPTSTSQTPATSPCPGAGEAGTPNGDISQRPKRRAAAVATCSLKEPSLTKKMRRDDPVATTIYTDSESNKKNKKR